MLTNQTSVLTVEPRCDGTKEVLSECDGNCDSYCNNDDRKEDCTSECIPGCVCQPGYARDNRKECVLRQKCPSSKSNQAPTPAKQCKQTVSGLSY